MFYKRERIYGRLITDPHEVTSRYPVSSDLALLMAKGILFVDLLVLCLITLLSFLAQISQNEQVASAFTSVIAFVLLLTVFLSLMNNPPDILSGGSPMGSAPNLLSGIPAHLFNLARSVIASLYGLVDGLLDQFQQTGRTWIFEIQEDIPGHSAFQPRYSILMEGQLIRWPNRNELAVFDVTRTSKGLILCTIHFYTRQQGQWVPTGHSEKPQIPFQGFSLYILVGLILVNLMIFALFN